MEKGIKGVEVADRLKEMVILRHISYAELARRAHITPSSVTLYMNGKRKPTIDTTIKMAKALGCSYETLSGGRTPEQDALSDKIQELLNKNVLSQKYKDTLQKVLDCLGKRRDVE